MKKILKLILVSLCFIPAIVLATPTSWDYGSGVLQPLQSQWGAQIKGLYFTSTSTTQQNTFPLASTTAMTAVRAYITQIANLTGNGFVKTGSGNGSLSIDTTTYESGLTAGDGLTRTANDFDFDGGDTPSGELGGTWASPTIDDGLAVTNWNLTSPTLTSFFGTPCTGNQFLQDIADNGSFSCATASGSGGSGLNFWEYTSATDTLSPLIASTSPNARITGSSFHATSTATSSTFNRLSFTYASGTAITATNFWGLSSVATALNANGANCSSGSAPLGVDASGAVEDCFDVWTEAENTAANYEQNLTAGDALTRTGDDFDFDGGATPSGDLGGTWASPSVTDDSHAHTGTTLSGIDVSDDTNLSADGTEIVLTGDALSLGSTLTFTTGTATSLYATGVASSSILSVSNGLSLFGGSQVTTANALCQQLTGSAALCDGTDASGSGGIATSSVPVAGNLAYWTSGSALSDVATGTLTESVTGLELSATRGLIGGASALSLTAGYSIPLTASTTEWDTAYSWGDHSLGGYLTGITGESIFDLSDVLGTSAASGTILVSDGTNWNARATSTLGISGGSGTVTSVDMSVPTGLSISGNPVTTSGTLALSYAAGYVGLLTASSTNWNTFYDTPSTRITAGTGIDWSGNTLNTVLTAGDGLTLTSEDFDCDIASGSVFGCLATTDWTIFNNKVSSTSIDTSAELRALVTDEIGTAQLVFNNPSTFSFGNATSSGSSTIDALTVRIGTTTNATSTSLFSALGTFTNSIINTLLTAANVVVTTVLQIPNGTGNTADDPGEIAHDTSDNQLILDDRVIRTKDEVYKFSISSTSPFFVSGVQKLFPPIEDGYVVSDIFCTVDGGTSKAVTLYGESITCDVDGQADDGAITIATIGAASTTVGVTMGATTGSVNAVNITVTGGYVRE